MILSNKNGQIKAAKALSEKKYRDQSGTFLAEGVRLVSQIMLSHPDNIERIFITEQTLTLISERVSINPFKERLLLVGCDVLNKLSDAQTSQGVAAVVKKPKNKHIGQRALFLDRIRDPGNLGTIIRTATAASYSLILNNCADIFSPKVVRASMGALMQANIVEGGIDALNDLKKSGFMLYAADMGGESVCITPIKEPFCVIIGNEADGIDEDIIKTAHKVIGLPMDNTESLNAAVSAAIIMYYYRYFI